MKGLISKFFGLLAVVAIVATSLVYVLDGTVMSSKYLNQAANRSSLYDNLALHLPELLAVGSPKPEVVKTSLSLFLTGDFMQQLIAPWFDSLEAYYKNGGPAPEFQLTTLKEQTDQYGVALPAGPPFDQPIVWRDPGLKPLMDRLGVIKLAGPLAALIFLGMTGMLFHGWGRYMAMAKTLVVAAFFMGALYLLAQTLPGLALSPLTSSPQLKILVPDITAFAKIIGGDLALSFGQIGIGLVIAAAGCLLLGLIVKVTARVGKHKETSVRPESNNRMGLS